jgi:Protein of unknown function (DUF4197)
MALRTKTLLALAGVMSLFCTCPVTAGLSDYMDSLKGVMATSPTGVPAAADSLSNEEVVAGLKAALQKGTRFAVESLGKDGGYLDNAAVRIPMPDSLAWVEKSLRKLGQDQLADEFVVSMNHAAEQAVPEAAAIFSDAIQTMTLDDARAILTGPDDAATQYFRVHTGTALTERMRPIISRATAEAGVTSAYKRMLASAGGLGSMLPGNVTDIDGYVTQEALDGLFSMIAIEEQQIRENPLARSSDLLKKVFGSVSP